MTELFRGFPTTFYQVYREVNPIDSGYRDRRDLYNLYHPLNHLNLFGGSYLSSVQRTLNENHVETAEWLDEKLFVEEIACGGDAAGRTLRHHNMPSGDLGLA